MSRKISNHFFHGLYLFDRDDSHSKYFDGSGPTHLLAEWPLFNRVPMAKKENGSFVFYDDVKKYLEVTDPSVKRPSDSFCKNYIKVKRSDLGKMRGLFHNLLKSIKVSHQINYELTGKSKGVKERTCCEKSSAANVTAEYKEEWGGHCCDAAVFGFYVDSSKLGVIDLNNASDCGSRSSGPFSISQELIVKRVFPVEILCELESCHGGITSLKVEGKNFTSSISLTPGKSCMDICVQPEDDFSEILCCCPPLHQKSSSSSSGSSSSSDCPGYVKSIGYECTRSHSKNVKVDFSIDTENIFNLSDLQKMIDGSRFVNIYGAMPLADGQKPVNEMSVGALPGGANGYANSGFSASTSSSTGQNSSTKLYKDDWVFIGAGDYKGFLLANSINKFPLIKDPVVGYSDEPVGYKCAFTCPFSNENAEFLRQKLEFSSKKLVSISLDGENSNLHHHDIEDEWDIVDTATYESSCTIEPGFFSEKDESYVFFINLKAFLYPGDVGSIRWNAGDYTRSEYKTGAEGNEKRSESSPISWNNGNSFESISHENSTTIGTDPRDLLGPDAFAKWDELKDQRKNWIDLLKVPVSFKFGQSKIDLDFECFKFKESSSKHEIPSSSSSSSSSSSCPLDKTIDCKWSNSFSLETSSYGDEDFSSETLFNYIK